jgi:hypothetical protein
MQSAWIDRGDILECPLVTGTAFSRVVAPEKSGKSRWDII